MSGNFAPALYPSRRILRRNMKCDHRVNIAQRFRAVKIHERIPSHRQRKCRIDARSRTRRNYVILAGTIIAFLAQTCDCFVHSSNCVAFNGPAEV